MNEEPVSEDFYVSVLNRWEIEEFTSEWRLFIQTLKFKVRQLYENQPEKLLQILYRLDVPEEQFIFSTQLESIEETVEYLTQKIIDRELKRYQFRKNYKG